MDPIAGCLGEGGFATVWEVHPPDSPPYALKIAKAATELSTHRMRHEAEALARVGAPWVPRLLGQGITDSGHAWLSMELIHGDGLGELIAQGIGAEQARVILRGLLEAVVHLHAAGVIHRDLKPDNVMVGADGRVTLLDLGMAREVGSSDEEDSFSGSIAGSSEYMAPEQLGSAKVTVHADVYSVGVIAFEIYAQRPPFVGSAIEVERGHLAMRPPPLVDAPADIEALCQAALRKDPSLRPDAAELLKQLRSEVAGADSAGRRRTTATLSVVRERPQPVVLMWAELARLDRNVLAMLGAHKFRVSSQRGRRVLAVILASDHPTPSTEAMAVAEELVATGARVVVHLADCVVSGERITGPALASPESWLPTGPWTGLRMTAPFAATVHRAVVAALDDSRFFALAEPADGEVLGREDELRILMEQLSQPEGGPGMVVVTGAVGVGKSTLAAKLAQLLTEAGTRVWQASVTPPGRDRGQVGGGQVFSSLVPEVADRPLMPEQADAVRGLARESPLVILLDDVDLAEHELLAAIEYMTLGGVDRCALWVVCFATGQLLVRRPELGERAQVSYRLELKGLKEESAVSLATRWLAPADYLPVASLRPLLQVAQGNPLHIVSLCRELREKDAIDAAALAQLPALALAPWMASRQLAGLPEETVALARVCAVLGESFDSTELAALVESLDDSVGARIAIDVEVGLDELCKAGVLEKESGDKGDHGDKTVRWRFANGLVCEGIYATLNDDERSSVHRLALNYWVDYWTVHMDDTVDQLAVPSISRHARALKDRLWAERSCAELARSADLAHRFVEAEQQWSAALSFVDDDSDRAEALVGRARARYRQQRMADAIVDARDAAEIARRILDRERLVDALLEEATALDWAEDFATSALRAEEARVCGTTDPGRQVRIDLAEVRAAFRRQRADSADALQEVAERATRLGDDETAVIAAMLAGIAFLMAGRIEEATSVFEFGEQAYRRSKDDFHFGALLVNRIMLWSARGEIERGIKDLREAIRYAREHGQAALERGGSYNLAEELLWSNQFEDAFKHAQRSKTLQERHGTTSAVTDMLLVLRIAAARKDREMVAQGLATIPALLDPPDRCFRDALANWLDPRLEESLRLLTEAEAVLDSQQAVEVGWLVLATGMLDNATSQSFYARARRSRVWRTNIPSVAEDDMRAD
ncbi:MAG: protein kinase [Myxococcales bacterium]|nr:protein kinase [Myxococcales bacterium]